MRIWRRLGRGALGAGLVVTLAGGAWAATFIVNSAADTTDGTCDTAAGGCTLREAIEQSVATPGRDTILFDGAVFPVGETTTPIDLGSALPVIADPAGTVVDGAGASVRINGGGTVDNGLVFGSGPGQPLTKVTVANVIVSSFTGTAVYICGGTPPICGEDVSGTVVRNVVANATTDGDGIRVEGHVVSKTSITNAVAFHIGGTGIHVFGDPTIVGARVQGSTAVDCDGGGIFLIATGDLSSGVITDSSGVQNGDVGLAIFGNTLSKPTVTHAVAHQNDGDGIIFRANTSATGATISDAAASLNNNGINLAGTGTKSAPALGNVESDVNTADGIALLGATTGAKITDAVSAGNGGRGLALPDGATGAKLTRVTAAGNGLSGGDGVSLAAATSTLQQVRSSGNLGDGIVLGAAAGGNSVSKSAVAANDGSGISVADQNGGNLVQKNVALGNTVDDLFDGNSSCDANTWKANVFQTGSQPCIH